MKKVLIVMLVVLLTACSSNSNNNEEEIKELPQKDISESSLMSDSPISASNIDEYLFLDDVMYVDTRSSDQFSVNGHIAGFVNIPFYEVIANFEEKDNVLFHIEKIRDENNNLIANVGDVGSFIPNYEESIEYLKDIFPVNKQIVFIATAGVESSYLINLLIQYGYDPANLYNAGSMENSLGKNMAYLDLENTKYLVKGIDAYHMNITYNWETLTKIEE